MIATPQRTRKLFAVGHLAPRSHCLPHVHRGPLNVNPEHAGWFGLDWATCSACGAVVVVGFASPELRMAS